MRTSKSIPWDFSQFSFLPPTSPKGIADEDFEQRKKKWRAFATIGTHFMAEFDLTKIGRARASTHTRKPNCPHSHGYSHRHSHSRRHSHTKMPFRWLIPNLRAPSFRFFFVFPPLLTCCMPTVGRHLFTDTVPTYFLFNAPHIYLFLTCANSKIYLA